MGWWPVNESVKVEDQNELLIMDEYQSLGYNL